MFIAQRNKRGQKSSASISIAYFYYWDAFTKLPEILIRWLCRLWYGKMRMINNNKNIMNWHCHTKNTRSQSQKIIVHHVVNLNLNLIHTLPVVFSFFASSVVYLSPHLHVQPNVPGTLSSSCTVPKTETKASFDSSSPGFA